MEIFLQPPNPEALSFEVDFQIQQAIVALRHSSIQIHGAGRFGDGQAAIDKHDADVPVALGALEHARMRVSHFVMQRSNSANRIVRSSQATAYDPRPESVKNLTSMERSVTRGYDIP